MVMETTLETSLADEFIDVLNNHLANGTPTITPDNMHEQPKQIGAIYLALIAYDNAVTIAATDMTMYEQSINDAFEEFLYPD